MRSPNSFPSTDENLYFIAIIPPPPIYDQALELKEYFKTHFNSKASLNSPPHITLHMPFRWRMKKERELAEQLDSFFGTNPGVDIRFNNYASFPPRVIYMNVVANPGLEELQRNLKRFCKRELNLFNADYKELAFHPHLTVAFRDLKKSNYERAWEEFKDKTFQGQFRANVISLLKHNGRTWEVFHNFKLQ